MIHAKRKDINQNVNNFINSQFVTINDNEKYEIETHVYYSESMQVLIANRNKQTYLLIKCNDNIDIIKINNRDLTLNHLLTEYLTLIRHSKIPVRPLMNDSIFIGYQIQYINDVYRVYLGLDKQCIVELNKVQINANEYRREIYPKFFKDYTENKWKDIN